MQQALPFVQVRDLPSSASFYSAITQPLKLRYISANSSSIVFGDTTAPFPEPVLEVRKVGAGQRPRPARVLLSAQSPSVVSAFRAAALRADPDILVSGDGERRVEIIDFDGNKIEVVCSSAPGYPTSNYAGSTAGSMLAPRDPRTMMRRSATTSTVEAPPPPSEAASRGFGNSGTAATNTATGFGAGTGIGTVLGAAAVGVAVGGALTYAFMRNDRQRAPRQEYDPPSTAVQRRASFPDPQPDRRTRYIEDSPRKYPPQSYGARYAQLEAPPRSRALEDIDDRRSNHYGSGSRSRRRSEAGSTRHPLMIADAEYMSAAPSRTGTSQKLLMDHEYRSQAGDEDDRYSRYAPSKYTSASRTPSKHKGEGRSRDASKSRASRAPDAETYVSARTRRSASTVRPAPQVEKRSSGRSRANSHVSRATWEDWDDDDNDDAASLAPSDSISCIGDDRHSRRSHRRSSHAGGATGSTVGRYRNVVNEFDGKRRPLYGSEYN
ncbi:uncharacterized protein F4822DRAFT_413055 [Hypoxylon trugodes]|uniref:uncharacterized protein n=1 Tax=Hypoxylon trugodes TaxID=326681 RepID=UPI00218DE5C3|nr:uncharacterized protein F4822DRAFT_413055 [Hypoxylon trugodes]KAI1385449.1 hypothetical protein F4822DRAFT_413055 [Hypoxylon trugodes]